MTESTITPSNARPLYAVWRAGAALKAQLAGKETALPEELDGTDLEAFAQLLEEAHASGHDHEKSTGLDADGNGRPDVAIRLEEMGDSHVAVSIASPRGSEASVVRAATLIAAVSAWEDADDASRANVPADLVDALSDLVSSLRKAHGQADLARTRDEAEAAGRKFAEDLLGGLFKGKGGQK